MSVSSMCPPLCCINPSCVGLAAYHATWRYMQYILFICGLLAFFLVMLFLPETIQTRSMEDKMTEMTKGSAPRRKWVWLNPFRPLSLLRSPNIMATVRSSFLLVRSYRFLIMLALNRHLRALSFCRRTSVSPCTLQTLLQ